MLEKNLLKQQLEQQKQFEQQVNEYIMLLMHEIEKFDQE